MYRDSDLGVQRSVTLHVRTSTNDHDASSTAAARMRLHSGPAARLAGHCRDWIPLRSPSARL